MIAAGRARCCAAACCRIPLRAAPHLGDPPPPPLLPLERDSVPTVVHDYFPFAKIVDARRSAVDSLVAILYTHDFFDGVCARPKLSFRAYTLGLLPEAVRRRERENVATVSTLHKRQFNIGEKND